MRGDSTLIGKPFVDGVMMSSVRFMIRCERLDCDKKARMSKS